MIRNLLLLGGLATAVLTAAPALAGDREDLLALEARWDRALIDKDRAALESILADDFVIVTADGRTGGKQDLIAVTVNWTGRVQPFETQDVRVRIYGDVAVLTGWFQQTVVDNGAATSTRIRYTDVYRRTDKGWVAVSAQATVAPPLPAQPAG